ncbi:MAG: hypothetical protein MJZ26_11435 [Fibrobacter sp.]|nr:hypothetical protein [Fibrobacter sp.]
MAEELTKKEELRLRLRETFVKGLNSYIGRTGSNPTRVSLQVGLSASALKNVINGTCKLPSFEIIYGLLDNGMTLEECFGPELAAKIAPHQSQNMDIETILQNLSPEEISLVSKRFAYLGLAGLLADLQRPEDPKERQA